MSSDACVSLLPKSRMDTSEPAYFSTYPAEAWVSFDPQNNGALAMSPEGKTISEASPWVNSVVRRALECSASAVGLLILLPVIAIVALCVWLESDGPIIFRQRRMGRNDLEFTLYKFRSMWIDHVGGPSVTAATDVRITRVGAFLRRYKLDELPQLWNIVRGDMSLIGPRPKLPHLEPLHMKYRPGITGAATLAFCKEEELLCEIPKGQTEAFYETVIKPAKACIDLKYMQTATLRSDMGILWRTLVGRQIRRVNSMPYLQEIICEMVSPIRSTVNVWSSPAAREGISNSQILADSESS